MAHSAVQWGDVPTWVASVLTGGSLLLGFYILLRDRRKEERAQAARVVTWNRTHARLGQPEATVQLFVRNGSDQPIRVPTFSAFGRSVSRMRNELQTMTTPGAIALLPTLEGVARITSVISWGYDIDSPNAPELEPSQRTDMTVELKYPAWCYDFFFAFTDASGVQWVRDLQANRLRTLKSWTRVYFGSERLTKWIRAVANRRAETKRFYL